MTVVKQPIEDGRGHDRVSEDRTPFSDGPVRRHQHGAALVAAADELEEQMRRIGLEGQIAELVDDQELGLGIVREPLLEPALAMGLGQLGDERRRRREQDRVAGDDGFPPDGDGQMGLADAGRAQEQDGLAIGDEAPRRDLADLVPPDSTWRTREVRHGYSALG